MRPAHAYVPGETPRHPEGAFDAIRNSVRPGLPPEALARTEAWQTGLRWLDEGFYWEAHEVLEPVWMAAPPNAPERHLVRAVIQCANARLKRRMGRENAARRLDALVAGLLDECALSGRSRVMGLDLAATRAALLGDDGFGQKSAI